MGIEHAVAPIELVGRKLNGQQGWTLATFLAIFCWLFFASPWLFGNAVIPWDAKDFYYPALRALASALHSGDSGFWDPWLRGGNAAVADPSSWVFTPTFRLVAHLFADPSMRLVDAVELMHLLAAGLGVLVLSRALGQKPLAALLAAIVVMFGGAAAGRLQHTMMVVSYAFLPWVLLLLLRSFTAPTALKRILSGVALGIVAGFMAVNRDQVAFLNCIAALAVGLFLLVRSVGVGGPRTLVRRALELAPGLLVGAVVLAVPILLTLDVLPGSTRATLDLQITTRASLQPATLLTAFAGDLFGNLDGSGYWGPGTGRWFALSADGVVNDPTTSYIFFGTLPLAFLLVAATDEGIRRRWLSRPETWLFGGLFAFATLYALGGFTPFFGLLYRYLPGVDLYRRPNDAVFLMNAMAGLSIGPAASALLSTPVAERRVSERAAAAAAAILSGILSVTVWLTMRLDQPLGRAADIAFALAALLAAAVVLRWASGDGRRAGLMVAIVALTAADLIAHNSGAQFNARPEANIAAYRPEGLRLADEIKRLLSDKDSRYRAEIFGLDQTPGFDGGGSWQNAALVYGIEQTLGYDALLTGEYSDAVGAEQNSNQPRRRLTSLFTGYDSPLARLLGIRLVVTGRPIETICPPSADAGLQLIDAHDGAYIYLNPNALPRAMVVERGLADGGGPLPADPTKVVLIKGLQVDDPETASGDPAGKVEITQYRADEVDLRVVMKRAGWLVLNDRFNPAWRATVDGAPVPVRRANRIFRAVRVPAGGHQLAFVFDPMQPARLLQIAARELGF